MVAHLHRKSYKVRASTTGTGLEITLPSTLKDDGVLKVGDIVEVLFDRLVVIVPPGQTVDPIKLANAIEVARQ